MVTNIKSDLFFKARPKAELKTPPHKRTSPPFRHVVSFPRRNDRPTRPTLPTPSAYRFSVPSLPHASKVVCFLCHPRDAPHSLPLLPLLGVILQPPTLSALFPLIFYRLLATLFSPVNYQKALNGEACFGCFDIRLKS
jgi:hypothetical protein